VITSEGRQIEVPAVHEEQNIDIQIKDMENVNEPTFDFETIYERRVYKA
jgi:hypothetical protein